MHAGSWVLLIGAAALALLTDRRKLRSGLALLLGGYLAVSYVNTLFWVHAHGIGAWR